MYFGVDNLQHARRQISGIRNFAPRSRRTNSPADRPEGQTCVELNSAMEIQKAARLLETAAYSLAGEIDKGKVTHLMLLAQQIERISEELGKGG